MDEDDVSIHRNLLIGPARTSGEMDEDDVSDDSFYSMYSAYGGHVYGMEIRYIRHGRRCAEPNCRTVQYSAEKLVLQTNNA